MTDFDPEDFFINEAKEHANWVQLASSSSVVDIYGIASPLGTGTVQSRSLPTRMFLHLLAWKQNDQPICEEELRLEMLFKDKDAVAPDHTIQPYGIVHVRAKLAQYADDETRGILEEIVSSKTNDTELELLAKDYKEPLIVHDANFGTLKYDRACGHFYGERKRKRKVVQLGIGVSNPMKINKGLSLLNSIWDNLANLDKRARSYACDDLLETLNQSWIEEGDRPISERRFIKRLLLTEISISRCDSFSLYYDDDDMFWGHVVEVRFNPDHSISEVCISG